MILVTVKNSKTGSQYICKSASRTVKNITYGINEQMNTITKI